MPYDPYYRSERRRPLRWYLLFGLMLTLPVPIIETMTGRVGDRTVTPLAFAVLMPLLVAWGSALLGIGVSLPTVFAEWMAPSSPAEPIEDDGELL